MSGAWIRLLQGHFPFPTNPVRIWICFLVRKEICWEIKLRKTPQDLIRSWKSLPVPCPDPFPGKNPRMDFSHPAPRVDVALGGFFPKNSSENSKDLEKQINPSRPRGRRETKTSFQEMEAPTGGGKRGNSRRGGSRWGSSAKGQNSQGLEHREAPTIPSSDRILRGWILIQEFPQFWLLFSRPGVGTSPTLSWSPSQVSAGSRGFSMDFPHF